VENFFPPPADSKNQLQQRLFLLALAAVVLLAAVLTLAPAVRLHSWQVAYPWQHWLAVPLWAAGFYYTHIETSKRLPARDPFLLPVTALLSGWGLMTIWRLDTTFGLRQTVWLVFGLILFNVGLRIPKLIDLLRRYKYLWLFTGLLLTAMTFVFGTYPEGQGPRLWFGFGQIFFQPSEPLKLLLIIFLAAYLADRQPVSFNLVQLLAPSLILAGASLFILLVQRDLGTASIFILLYFAIVYLASGRRRILLFGAGLLLVAGIAGYALIGVLQVRVDSWLTPWLDPSGSSYQIVQSLLAVASGRLFGSGLGLGSPGVVPVALSDFIFSAIAEETGFLGMVALMLLLVLLSLRAMQTAIQTSNNYRRFLAAGLGIYFMLQSILIVGGNLRLLPLTGVTLPFVSYGGSSLVTSFAALLILVLLSNTEDDVEPAPLLDEKPYLFLSGWMLACLAAVALIGGWWAIIRSDDLLTRNDNPRLSIADRYVPRGTLLDRRNAPIAVTEGDAGSYQRDLLYPPLSLTVGYIHPVYGQAGLEQNLNDFLRGYRGTPASTIYFKQLLYNQPPEGLDVRLSIDLQLQEKADEMMSGHSGALVLLNAQSGEVLAISSHPYFDPNQTEASWEAKLTDPTAPFFNRATLGQYPPGTALGPFLLSAVEENRLKINSPEQYSLILDGEKWECSVALPDNATFYQAVAAGCPGASLRMGTALDLTDLKELYQQLGFDQALDIPLPSAGATDIVALKDQTHIALGQDAILVTPLQMALAAASLSAEGVRPSPAFAAAVNTPLEGWVILPAGEKTTVFQTTSVSNAADKLPMTGLPAWETVASARRDEDTITWYLAGTTPGWRGVPLAIALVLEEDNPQAAIEIGTSVLDTILNRPAEE
jgi:cell division protein FtsW (lipid II flippase)